MEILGSYELIIVLSGILILSYLFNIISEKTNIPSVLMLIVTGIVIQQVLNHIAGLDINFFPMLEILGIVGLIMIVLEAALDLELHWNKSQLIIKSFLVGLFGLLGCLVLTASIFHGLLEMDWLTALIYATPMSIMSSAIIIPSVQGLSEEKKEFMIYESTFSDILGIMLFYFLLSLADSGQVSKATTGFIGNLALTIVVSLVAGYALIYLFQHIRAHIKLFLLIAILLLLYSLAKLMHLSALIIILMFGLMLSNRHIFFKGFLKKLIHTERVEEMEDDFKLVTAESAFLIRTFFFVVFGITIVLSSLIDLKVWLISILVILAIFVLRFILVRLALGKNYMPELFLAPRGLITILLFFGIPAELQVGSFNSGILLFLIIATSIIMTAGLISSGKKKKEAMFGFPPGTVIEEPDESKNPFSGEDNLSKPEEGPDN